MYRAAGEAPDEVGVDGPEGEASRFGARAGAIDMMKQPGDLGAGEIGVEEQPGVGGKERLGAVTPQRFAVRRRAAVLPDDGGVDRLTRGAIPHQGRFALIGDTDGGNGGRGQAGLGQSFAAHRQGRVPNLLGVVLDPTGMRITLGQLALGSGEDFGRAVEQDGARRGRALVDRQNDVRHAPLYPPVDRPILALAARVRNWLEEAKMRELYFQNPGFGFAVMRLITTRLLEDAALYRDGQPARA